jgi:hypothetical protein
MGLKHEAVWSLAILLFISFVLGMSGCTHVRQSSDSAWEYPHE